MSTTLPLFWHLSSASKKERFDASIKLVGALEQFQAQFVPKEPTPGTSDGEDEDENETQPDGIDALNAQDVSYSIRRLIRGLASPRESSRLGFAVALTELLSRIETVTCSDIVLLVIDSSQTAGSMTGQEERDVLFARLFGLTAVIQSGLLVRQKPLPTSACPSTLPGYHEMITQLLILGEKKSWLRESAWWTLTLAIDALQESEAPWKEDAVTSTVESIFMTDKNWSPEKVALALKLQRLHPKLEWKKLLSPFKNPDLLHTGNLVTLARILKESPASDDEGADVPTSAAGLWKPGVHFVWDIALDQLLPGLNSTTPSRGSFQEFFRIVVDESLFSSTSSPERKYWGFQIFQRALSRVTEADMPMLFTKNFMRSWINHLSNNDRYLHNVAQQVATEIQAFVQKNPTLGFSLISQLTGVNGSRHFDKMTKTRTVESILASMNTDGIKNYINHLLKQINEGDGTERSDIQTINSRRAWIIEQFAALIRNGSIPKSDDWIQWVLEWLVVNGLFVVKKVSNKSPYNALHLTPTPAFSEDLQQNCRTRLLSCLADLTSQTTVIKPEENKTSKVFAVASDGELWVSKVLNIIEQLEKDTKHVAPLSDTDEDDQALRAKAREVADRLKRVSGHQEEEARGAELLLLATLLQHYCAGFGDESDETISESLEACIDGATRMFPAEGQKGNEYSKLTSRDIEEPVPDPIDVLVDAIIGFLEKSTAYMRAVSNQAFSLLSSSVQESTINLILTQLERRSPAEEAADDDADHDDLSEEDNADEDENESDGSEEDEEEQSSAEQDHTDSSNDEAVDPELRKRIEEALRINGIEAATDGSDEESEEEPMNDDQMMAVDEQLAQVFRARVNENKRKDTDAQREATYFKNRVLDLVDTYIKKQPSSPHLTHLILPLVELIVGTGTNERQLSDKVTGLLKNRIGKSKETPVSMNPAQDAKLLEDLHRRAQKVHSPDLLATISQCSLYLSKVLLQTVEKESVHRVYRQSLIDFLTRKTSSLNNRFFEDFVRRLPASAWNLREDLIEISRKATNVYRRCQAFQLLQMLISQSSFMDDRREELLLFMPQLRQALYDFMTSACNDQVKLSASQMKDLFKLSLISVRQTKRAILTPEELAAIWLPKSWNELLNKLAASDRFKASSTLQTMCRQVAQSSQMSTTSAAMKTPKSSHINGAKRKAEDVSGDESRAPSKKTKQKVKQVNRGKI